MRKNYKYTQLESGADAIDGWCTLKRDDGRIVKVKKPRFWELFRKGRIVRGLYGKENRNI